MNGKPIDFENGKWAAIIGGKVHSMIRHIEHPQGIELDNVHTHLHEDRHRTRMDSYFQQAPDFPHRAEAGDKQAWRKFLGDQCVNCFWYIARCEPFLLNKFLDYFGHIWMLPLEEWPSNLFEGVLDENVNTVLATLDMRGIGGDYFEHYARIKNQTSNIKVEAESVKHRLPVHAIWHCLYSIRNTDTVELIGTANSLIKDFGDEHTRETLLAIAISAKEERLMLVLKLFGC